MKEIITSRQNPLIREVAALGEKKHRRQTGLFRFDGVKLLREALAARVAIRWVLVRMPCGSSVEDLLRQALEEGRLSEEQVVSVGESAFERLTDERAPEGVVTVAEMPHTLHRSADAAGAADLCGRKDRLLLAESLRDPGNLGTVMRSCAALGIDCLILTDDCAELYSPKTLRAAMGALFRLRTVTVPCEELPTLIGALREHGRQVFGAALRETAQVIGRMPLSEGDCFVIGNEGHGLSEACIAACNGAAIIPMREGNESLNAAAAAAICIWETVRAAESADEKETV